MLDSPGLTVSLAMAVGMIAQALAHHVRVPGIVLLLAAGLALGPDGVGVIRPAALGPALSILTGFAVAVILFEGGINLKFRSLRRAQQSIRRLILLGGLVTVTGAAAAAHYVMGWPWMSAVLFGTLALTANDEVNFLFIQKVKEERKGIPLWAALKSDSVSMTTRMLHGSEAALVFGKTLDVARWDRRFNGRQVQFQRWQCVSDPSEPEAAAVEKRLSQQGWQCVARLDSEQFSTSVCNLQRPPQQSAV